jgi:hypothetical protein
MPSSRTARRAPVTSTSPAPWRCASAVRRGRSRACVPTSRSSETSPVGRSQHQADIQRLRAPRLVRWSGPDCCCRPRRYRSAAPAYACSGSAQLDAVAGEILLRRLRHEAEGEAADVAVAEVFSCSISKSCRVEMTSSLGSWAKRRARPAQCRSTPSATPCAGLRASPGRAGSRCRR